MHGNELADVLTFRGAFFFVVLTIMQGCPEQQLHDSFLHDDQKRGEHSDYSNGSIAHQKAGNGIPICPTASA